MENESFASFCSEIDIGHVNPPDGGWAAETGTRDRGDGEGVEDPGLLEAGEVQVAAPHHVVGAE